MTPLLHVLWPELVLAAAGCVLLLLGVSLKASARRLAAWGALLSLAVVFVILLAQGEFAQTVVDPWNSLRVFEFAHYIKLLSVGVGVLLVLLAWPTDPQAMGNPALDYGPEAGEFFGLMLLSISGLLLVAGANDMIVLFLGIELASIPTYVMVTISRPQAVAQEAGVKYFFLGAMSAAVMLFGFSYLYGTTGLLNLDEIAALLAGQEGGLTSWQLLAVLLLIAGFAFKMAAVPLHFYAGDVYQGAATPVTAFLAYVPKATGFVALIKLLWVVGGADWLAPTTILWLLWVMAVATMTVGNVLALIQLNVKRVLAYSSIAHTGYMLVGLTVLVTAGEAAVRGNALQGVLFYLAAYGIMNSAAFGVLMLLPSRPGPRFHGQEAPEAHPPAMTAETFEDIAGQGRRHPGLGLAMAVACFSLIGLPLTVGFLGKVFIIWPALQGGLIGLAILTFINAAISAAYYLRIVGTMFLRPEPRTIGGAGAVGVESTPAERLRMQGAGGPIYTSILLSVVLTLGLGTVLPAAQWLYDRAERATALEGPAAAEEQAATRQEMAAGD